MSFHLQECHPKVTDFIEELMSGKIVSEKNSVKAYQCTVLNPKQTTMNLQHFNEIEPLLTTLTAYDSRSDFLKVSKIIRNGYVIYSKSCTKVKKRNSYSVKMVEEDNSMEIDYFLFHKLTEHVFAVGRRLLIVGPMLSNRMPHIPEVRLDK